MKNILIISSVLIIIMLVATSVVLGFNSLIGFSMDLNNNDVATSVAAVAFGIALVLRYVYVK